MLSHSGPESDSATTPKLAKLVIGYTASNLTGLALWYNSILSPLVYLLFGKSNLIVGIIACIYGAAALFGAFISARATDAGGDAARAKMLYAACGLALLGIAAMVIATTSDFLEQNKSVEDRRKLSLPLYVVGNFFVGAAQGTAAANVETSIASCTQSGQRDKIYATKFLAETASGIAGIIMSVALFLIAGNNWSILVLSCGMYLGLFVQLCTVFVLFAVAREDQARTNASSSPNDVVESAAAAAVAPTVVEEEGEEHTEGGEEEKYGEENENEAGAKNYEEKNDEVETDDEDDDDDDDETCSVLCCNCLWTRPFSLRKKAVPYVIATQAVIVALGSGMTMRYVVLFLLDDYKASPLAVVICLFCAIVLQMFFTKLNQIISSRREVSSTNAADGADTADPPKKYTRYLTRIQQMLIIRGVGPLGLLYLGFNDKWPGPWSYMTLTCVAVALRLAITNSSVSLSRSLTMDFTRIKERARWNAVESLLGASWAGSALLGGVLADQWGYRVTFLITFFIHLIAFCALCLGVFTPEIEDWDRLAEIRRRRKNKHEHDEGRVSSRAFDDGDDGTSRCFAGLLVPSTAAGAGAGAGGGGGRGGIQNVTGDLAAAAAASEDIVDEKSPLLR